MKAKILNLLLVLTSLMGYLEWGKDNRSFLFQAEGEILSKAFSDPSSVIHPFTMLPMIGQLLLLWTLFQKKPHRILTFTGMAGIGILITFMFAIGVFSLNFRIVLSTLPFLIVGVITIRYYRRAPSAIASDHEY